VLNNVGMRLRFTLVILVGLLVPGTRGKAQDSVRCGSWVSVNAHYGFIMPAYKSSTYYLLKGHCPGFEIDYLLKMPSERQWVCTYHYPEIGYAFFFSGLGNPNELGNMYGIYPFVNFHLNRNCKERLYFRMGIGIGYLPITFDQQTNHKNEMIGAHINAMVNMRLTYHFYLSDNMRIETGLGATHCSDGSFKTPNLGINLLTLNTGLSYCFNNKKMLPATFDMDTSFHKHYSNELFIGFGASETEPPGGCKYGAVTVTYDIYHVISRKSKLGLGTDMYYNGANIARMKPDVNLTPVQNFQMGIKGSYELCVGKFAMPLEQGFYLYNKSKFNGNNFEYNRIGVRYYATKHLAASITLLTHYASADYIEWGAGYRF